MIRAALGLTSLAFLLSGCFQSITEIGKDPKLTPVGTGLAQNSAAINNMQATPVSYTTGASLWKDSGADLFKDPRAGKVGDVVTVRISIKDQASISNSTSSSRDSSRELNFTNTANLSYSNLNPHTNIQSTGQLDPKIQSNTSSAGQAAISRSETIDLLIGAVVTSVLPNGNLVVSGRQEVLVNRELRELLVSGIVRPRDISTENSISYDKIAEARISYGGRGRTMDVQQPGWGQRVFDQISPF
ncbi:MAG: flagellar basal body L-ring protein FlgH [Rhodomicrobium sp.]